MMKKNKDKETISFKMLLTSLKSITHPPTLRWYDDKDKDKETSLKIITDI